MNKELSKGCTAFKCQGSKAGQSLFKTFNRSQAYSQKNPGEMIKAMAMFEVLLFKTLVCKKNLSKDIKTMIMKVQIFYLRKKMKKKLGLCLVLTKVEKL